MDIEICCSGATDVLGPSDAIGAGGTGGAGDVGNGAVTAGVVGAAICGSFVSFVGWSTAMFLATS